MTPTPPSAGGQLYHGIQPIPDAPAGTGEYFKKLSDSLSVALLMVDPGLHISYWNKKAEELTGLSRENAVGKLARDVFPMLSGDLQAQFLTALRTRTPFSLDRMRYRDKLISGVFGIRTFMVNDDLAVLVEDKTQQVIGEKRLKASEERFRTLSESMSLALVMIDRKRKITYWNRMSSVLSQMSYEEAVGADALDVLPMTEARLSALLEEARNSPEGVKIRINPDREGVINTYDVRAFSVGSEVALLVENVTVQVQQAKAIDQSTQELLDLYHHAPCGYLTVQADGVVARANNRIAKWLEFLSPTELAGNNVRSIVSRRSIEKLEEALRNATLEEPVNNLELEFRSGAGREFWGLVNTLPYFDTVTSAWCFRWTVMDITELHSARKQLEDSALFAQLFNELGEGVLISDTRGRILRANRAAARILGIGIEELTQLTYHSPVWKVVSEDGRPIGPEGFPAVQALRNRQPVTNLEHGIIRPDGTLTWILESAAPLYNDKGEMMGVIVTFPEITSTVEQHNALKELNDKLAVERDKANESNRLKSSFLANMSHEIRTPMTAILGFSDILSSELAGKVSEQHQTFLRSINVSGKRLLNLINDILDLSKIEAGKLDLQIDAIDIHQEIEAVITTLIWIAKQKGLTLRMEKSFTPLFIQCDRQRFGQVLTNIISNAIKFTRTGSITIRANAESYPSSEGAPQHYVSIEIEDTGIGITREFLPFLFEEFRQEHTGVTKEFGGTGLGLAISKRLVSLMGGSIQVRSQQNVGTTFTLTFPLTESSALEKSDHVTGAAITPEKNSQTRFQSNNTQETDESGLVKKHVLVVEDNTETQRLLQVYLKTNYRVSQAVNAREASDVLESDPPDIILMDVNLPGKDGLTLTREIRSGTIVPDVPIIALTAFAMSGDRQRCIDAGCNNYLSKPATKKEVLQIITATLEKLTNA